MRYKAHEYQQKATDFIVDNERAAVFLEMGLGKTVITLTALWELLFDRFETAKALIVAPLRVARDTWPSEIGKWDHTAELDFAVAVGSEKERKTALAKNASITIINRENVSWLIQKSGYDWDFDTVVIDELSSFKNHQAKRFKALKKVRPHIKRLIGLTGTPSPNGLMDLWAQYRLIDGGERLGRFIGHYRDTFFTPDKRNQHQVFTYKPRSGAERLIYSKISDITLSMRTTDYLKLPSLTTVCQLVKMSGKEAKNYQELERELVATIEDKEITALNAASLAGKLCQMASGAVYTVDKPDYVTIHSRKLDALEDIIEAANGKPVLVAYWFGHDLTRLRERFPTARCIKTSQDIKDWNAGSIEIGLIHPASASHGLNLQTGGHLLVWFSLTWSLELYQQTNARLYRQGQTQPVTITYIITENTIDERVLSALKTRNTTQERLLEAVKTTLKGAQK